MLCGGQYTACRFGHGRPRDWLAGHVLDESCARADESMDHRLSFVAEKAIPSPRKSAAVELLMPCIRKPSVAAAAVEERRHCLLQLGRAAMEAPSG
jgi:hypothetical protein